MGKIKINCTFSKSDTMKVDHMCNQFGFDIFNNGKPIAGILVNYKEARELIQFLQDKLDENE